MSKAAKKKEQAKISPELYDVIQSPVVTEKSQNLIEQGKITLNVAPSATKDLVKRAVEGILGVTVKKVNITVVKGKTKKFRGTPGKRKDVKKAIVTLADGQTVDFSSKI